jgi:tRNA G18 (ribose-2'-O)-methylase SpoU
MNDCDDDHSEHDLQVRRKPLRPLERPREIIVALPPMKSHVNLSRIVRTAGCFGITKIIACGNAGVVSKIARDAGDSVTVDIRRTLPPVLKKLRDEGCCLVALEQTDNSHCLYDYRFVRKCVLVIGNEKLGVDEETLRLVDDVVEIPMYGLPYAQNAASSAIIAMYEFCRQFPDG